MSQKIRGKNKKKYLYLIIILIMILSISFVFYFLSHERKYNNNNPEYSVNKNSIICELNYNTKKEGSALIKYYEFDNTSRNGNPTEYNSTICYYSNGTKFYED